MSYSIKRLLNVGFLLIMFSALMFSMNGTARAQEGSVTTEEPEQSESEEQDFRYVAQAGDNLTKLVRRTIELYAQNAEIDLSDGKAIAAETWVVQDLGSYELAVGQEVTIPESEIEKAVNRTDELSEAVVSSWASYGPITRNLTDVQPVSAPAYVAKEDTRVDEKSEDSDDSQDEETGDADNNDSSTNTTEADSGDDQANDDAPWYWWLIGGSALGAMWYVLGGNEAVKNRRKK